MSVFNCKIKGADVTYSLNTMGSREVFEINIFYIDYGKSANIKIWFDEKHLKKHSKTIKKVLT